MKKQMQEKTPHDKKNNEPKHQKNNHGRTNAKKKKITMDKGRKP